MAGKKKRNHNNLTPKEQQFCDLYSRYAGNIAKVASAMHISIQVCSTTYLQCDRVKEYLGSTLQRSRDRLIQALPAILDNAVEMVHNDTIPPNVKAQLTIALMDRAGLQPPKGQVNINTNVLISDRARELLAQRTGVPLETMPPALAHINIMEEKCGDLT